MPKTKSDDLLKDEVPCRNPDPFQLQHPYRAVSCGKSGSGKTTWILKNIILKKDSPFDSIVWCAPRYSLEQPKLQTAAKKLNKSKLGKMHLVEGLDKEVLSELIENKPKDEQMLIVLDDLMAQSGKDDFVNNLFTAGRHRNISTIEILQRIFCGNRTQRLNSEYFILHDFSDRSEVRRLFQQLEPKNIQHLMNCYDESIDEDGGHGALLVDTKYHSHQDGSGLLKYRKNALDEGFVV